MSLRKRLGTLEARAGAGPGGAYDRKMARLLQHYFVALENTLRESEGLDPRPDPPLTREDLADELMAIKSLRESPGWQSDEARQGLDEWESRCQHHF